MGRAFLFLVDRQGRALPAPHRSALEAAYGWASHDYPQLDPAMLATWAEQIGVSMSGKEPDILDPRRYVFAAMQNKIRDHFRGRSSREVAVGISRELETWAGSDFSSARNVERQVLFRELRTHLSERDRHILILLQQDVTSPASVASSLGISYNAAAKAIQRVKDRLRSILTGKPILLESQGTDDNV